MVEWFHPGDAASLKPFFVAYGHRSAGDPELDCALCDPNTGNKVFSGVPVWRMEGTPNPDQWAFLFDDAPPGDFLLRLLERDTMNDVAPGRSVTVQRIREAGGPDIKYPTDGLTLSAKHVLAYGLSDSALVIRMLFVSGLAPVPSFLVRDVPRWIIQFDPIDLGGVASRDVGLVCLSTFPSFGVDNVQFIVEA
jgi:hypothetical protein